MELQALITFLTPLVIQLAKRSQLRALAWIDQSKPKICLLTSAVAALLTSMEIEVVHTSHQLTITWPDGARLAHGLTTFLVAAAMQFGGQHVFYDSLWKQVVPTNAVTSDK
jgi:fumarate reductase subunit D